MDISFSSLGYFIKPVRVHVGWWSHDHYQNCPKNQSCSPMLYLPESVWIMFWSAPMVEIWCKRFWKALRFFFLFFCIFFHENQTKQHDFTTFRKLEERATIIVSWEKWLKKGRCMPYSALHVRLEFKSHEKLFVLVVCDWCHAAGFRSGNCVVLRNT